MSEITLTQEDLEAQVAKAVEAATTKMAAKNEELMGELKKARKRVEAFKDFDPDDVQKALLKAKEQQTKAQEALASRGEYEKALKQAQAQHAEELGKARKDLEAAQKEVKAMLVNTEINQAMAAAGIAEPFRKAVAAMHSSNVSVIEDEGAKKAVVGDKSVTDFLKEWAGTDEGKNFVAASGDAGGGANGGKGAGSGQVNPWAPDTRNLTLQGQLERDNPLVASQMKREAGVEAA